MFNDIPKPILNQMRALEEIDSRDRQDDTPNLKRLRQIPPESGAFLALLAGGAPKGGAWLEIGTSGGYSALWLALAARNRGEKLITFELLHDKAEIARETFAKAEVEDVVEFVNGDGRGHIGQYEEIAFCFMDAEKEMYEDVYDQVIQILVTDGIFAADNAISHQDFLAKLLTKIRADERVDSIVLPIGKGILVCRKLPLEENEEA